MKKKDCIAVWLTDGYARLLLGVSPSSEASRWVTIGERHEDASLGLWIKVERIEERRSDGKRIIYTINPNMCIVRWDGIITIQSLKKGVEPEVGIQP